MIASDGSRLVHLYGRPEKTLCGEPVKFRACVVWWPSEPHRRCTSCDRIAYQRWGISMAAVG